MAVVRKARETTRASAHPKNRPRMFQKCSRQDGTSAGAYARFIFVKRDPDDIELRIYMKKYHRGNAYAYDIGNIREHVAWYNQMVDVVAERVPHISMVIQYENMIADPAAALRPVAELCGLAPPDGPLPQLGDDRGCAAPYREFMAAASKG